MISDEKKKVLFYFDEGVDAWVPCPVPNKDLDQMFCVDDLEEGETHSVQFKVFMMTEKELAELPED